MQGSAELELPSGAAMVIPAGPHQVTNVGEVEVKILFVEVSPWCLSWQREGNKGMRVSYI